MTNRDEKISIPEFHAPEGHVIGVGIDLVARERVARMLDRFGDRFLRKYFTPGEAEYCMSRPDPVPDLAVRLAAKEAGFKAIGARRGMGIGWTDFEVVLDSGSVPWLSLHGRAHERGEKIGAGKVWLSLTHEDLWVAAVVVVTSE